MVARGQVGQEEELLFNRNRASVWQDEELYGWMVVMAAQKCECT